MAVDADRAVLDTPIFHDGSNAEQDELVSGELHCTLRALTPLLVGHEQFACSQVDGAVVTKSEINKGSTIPLEVQLPKEWGVHYAIAANKKVIQPLRLKTADGRVAIPGASIKGMLRQSIGALLNAPMERVTEQSFSYRPNLDFGHGDACYEVRPAVITGIDADGSLNLLVLPGARDAIFVRGDAESKMGPAMAIGCHIAPQKYPGVHLERKRDGSEKLVGVRDPAVVFAPSFEEFRCCGYAGGIDGSGYLAKAFDAKRQTYRLALVRKTKLDAGLSVIVRPDSDALLGYKASQLHLADATSGHISARHPLSGKYDEREIRKAISEHTDLHKNQLIYVEIDTAGSVTSLGHHFRYRQRYADTVRTKWQRYTMENPHVESTLRPELAPRPEEQPTAEGQKHVPPRKLSGARLVMGYVAEGAMGTGRIGVGDFKRLAGRVAPNMAIEVIEPGRRRFLEEDGQTTTLKVLGLPRPSAAEFYLQQAEAEIRKRGDGGAMLTYGDIAGRDPGGSLNGRAFIPHQPVAGDEKAGANCFDLWTDLDILDDEPDGKQQFMDWLSRQPWGTGIDRNASSRQLGKQLLVLEKLPLANVIERWEAAEKQRNYADPDAFKPLHNVARFFDALGHIVGDKAAFARFASTPGTKFRFTFRFRDLRRWELGAVLLALDPSRVRVLGSLPAKVSAWLEKEIPSATETVPNLLPAFAVKLGYARPLGWGSAKIDVDKLLRLDEGSKIEDLPRLDPDPDLEVEALKALGQVAFASGADPDGNTLLQWLKIHRYKDRGRIGYPLSRVEHQIFSYHTAVRREESKLRRLGESTAEQRQKVTAGLLKELD